MKINKITINNRKKSFELEAGKKKYDFPFSQLRLKPKSNDKIKHVEIDEECANEAFTYLLESNKEDTVPMDAVLSYNKDPDYEHGIMLYRLSMKAQKLLAKSQGSKREIIRRMGTSPTQFYRLIDQTNYNKTIEQMLKLLRALDCTVEFTIKKAA